MSDLPHRPTLFLDRNSGGRKYRDLISRNGPRVVLHDEYFKDNKTPDEVWVKEIGRLGWIMVTCDCATIKSLLFLSALKRSRARVFLINALNGATPEEKAQHIICAYEKMVKICKDREAPLFWQFNKGGEVYAVDFRHKLGMLRRNAVQTRSA